MCRWQMTIFSRPNDQNVTKTKKIASWYGQHYRFYLLNNKTIILLDLAEYRLILANLAYDLVS